MWKGFKTTLGVVLGLIAVLLFFLIMLNVILTIAGQHYGG